MYTRKNWVVKKIAAGAIALLLVLTILPFGGLLNIANAQEDGQFNKNLSAINANWGTNGSTRVGADLIFNQAGIGQASTMIPITDTDLQTAIDTSAVRVSSQINASVSGFGTPVEGEPDYTVALRISFGADAGSAYLATPAATDSYTVTGNESFSLDTSNATIPAGTRYIMVLAEVTTPAQVDGTPATMTLNNSVTIIPDTENPTIESTYNSEWTNQNVVVTITAADNIGTRAIFGDGTFLTASNEYQYTVSNEGVFSTDFYAIDYAENVSETLTVTVDHIDKTPPGNITEPVYYDDWTNLPVTVTFAELTQTAGTSPISYAVSTDGGNNYQTFSGNEYTITISGNFTTYFKKVDEAGNESANTISVTTKHDGVDPVINSVNVERVQGSNNYTVNADDAHSGLAEVKYAAGTRTEEYFATGGTDITATMVFSSTTAQTFTVFAKDNAGNATCSLVSEQNVLPSIAAIGDMTIAEDADPFEIELTVGDDTTADADLLISAVSSDTSVLTDRTAYERDGSIYLLIDTEPDANTGAGAIMVTVTVEDEDSESVSETFDLTVTPVNDAPAANDDLAGTNENTAVVVDVLDNDTDIENSALTIDSFSQPENGTVTQVDETLEYTPDLNWGGEDSFTYVASDGEDVSEPATVTVTVSNANDAPIAQNDTAVTNEDENVQIAVLDNDFDPDEGVDPEETMTVSLAITETALGTVSVVDNVIVYDPDENEFGVDTFEYTLTDRLGLTDTASVTVTVQNVNDAPVIFGYPVNYSIPEDSVGETFVFNVSDVETDYAQLMVQVVSQKPTLIDNRFVSVSVDSLTGECTVTLSSIPNAYGTLSIKLIVSDGTVNTEYLLPVTVSAQNDPPVAASDDMTEQWTVFEGVTKQLDLSVLTGNDTDIDEDSLEVTAVSSVSNGALTPVSGEIYNYTSDASYSGIVTFTYTVSDGQDTDTATVTMRVLPTDDAPTLAFEPTNDYDCEEDLFENLITVYAGDEDTDYSNLVVTVESDDELLLSSDSITVHNLGSGTYQLELAPTEHGNGEVNITVYLSDGTTKVNDTFAYTITPAQDAPVALDDEYFIAKGRTEYIIPIANDYDFDNEALDYVAIDGYTLPEKGTLVRSNRGFRYTAPADSDGIYTFTYKITDGTDETYATVTLNVGNYDDLNIPQVSEISDVNVTVNTVLGDIPFTASHTNGIASVTAVSSNQAVVADGDISVVDHGDGSYDLVFASVPVVAQTTQITMTVTSTNGRVAVKKFYINVYPVNETPIAVDDVLTGAGEDQGPFAFTAADLLGNDLDAEGEDLHIVNISDPAGTTIYITYDGSGYLLHYPNNDFNGDITFSYWISDGHSVSFSGNVLVTVEAVDDLPNGWNDSYALANETGSESITISKAELISDDYDADGDTLYFFGIADGPQYGTLQDDGFGNLVYTRTQIAPGTYGEDTFTYYVADEDPDSPGFNVETDREALPTTVTIHAPYPPDFYVYNRWFDIYEDADPFEISVSFAKNTGYEGTFVLESVNPNHGTAAIVTGTSTNGSDLKFSYEVDDGYFGTDYFSYTVRDSETGRTKTAMIYITVVPINDAPVFTVEPETDWVRNEDGSMTLYTEFTDEDNDIGDVSLSVYITNQSSSNPVALNRDIVVQRASVDADTDSATVTVPFVGNASGSFSVVFKITDGIDDTTVQSDGTVLPVDDPPVCPDVAVDSIEEDTSVMTDVMTLVSDPDNSVSELVLTISSGAANGTAAVESGQILYVPDFNYFGTDSVTYRVASQDGLVYDEGTITYTVLSVNDKPYVYDVEYYVVTDEDMPVTADFKAFDYEDDINWADEDEVTYTFESSNTTLIPVENIVLAAFSDENKQLTITPDADCYGSAVITIVATDTDGAQTRLDFNVVVTSVNDLPTGVPDSAVTDEDTSVTFDVLGNDYDPEDSAFPDDNLKMTIASISQTAHGAIVVNAGSGQITYTPLLNDNGTDTFTYTLMDNFGETVDVAVTVTINPVNDAPIAVDDMGVVDEGGQVQIDLLENDTDIEIDSGETTDTLSIVSVSGNMAGSAISHENGVLTYTASSDIAEAVVDELSYTITDGDKTDTGSISITVNEVNDPPTAENDEGNNMTIEEDSWEFAEDTTGVFVVNIGDPETDISNLLVTIASDGQAYVEDHHITLQNTPEGNKQITIVPRLNAFGQFTITFTVSDGQTETTAYFPVTITPVNDPPVLSVEDITVAEEATATKTATATDAETAQGELVYSLETQAGHGTAVVAPSGTYSYTSDINYNGADSFEVTVADGDGGTDTKTVNVTVTGVNDAPTARNDNYTIDESTPASFNVLLNDSDPDEVYGDELTIVSVSTPTHGSAVINGGQIDYTPEQYNNKTATFSYTVSDGTAQALATVTVTFNAVDNDPADGNDTYTIAEDSGIHNFDVLLNDDVDTDPNLNVALDTLTLLSVSPTTPGNSLVCEIADNELAYQPAQNFNGTDEVTYTMRDANEETAYTFTVLIEVTPVNDPPTISDIADDLSGNPEDTNITASCEIGDVETHVDALVVTAVWDNDTLIDDVVISGTGQTRTITVVPEANMSGQADITVTVKDASNATASDTFTVVIDPVDDTPSPAADTATTNENTTIYIDVLANDDDDLLCEGDDLEIVPGSIAVSTDTPYAGGVFNIVSREVNQPIVNANGTVTVTLVTRDVIEFIPDADWTSTENYNVVVTYAMREVGETDEHIATDMLTITVTPVNDAPTIDIDVTDDQITILEDAATGTGVLTVNVDDEEDGNVTLNVTLDSIVEDPGNYTPQIPLLLQSGVSILPDTDDTRTLQAIMQADESGIVNVTLRVTDSGSLSATDTLEITVTPQQDAPTGGDDLYETDEDTPVLLDVLENDDVDQSTQGSESSLVQIVSQPANGLAEIVGDQLRYTPDPNYYNDGAGEGEDDTFEYEMMDGNGATATFTVTMYVNPVNDAPVLYFVDDELPEDNKVSTPEATPRTLTLYATDVDLGDTAADLQLTGVSSNTIVVMNGDIDISGPVDNAGDAYFTVVASPFLRWNGITNLTFTVTDPYARETGGYVTLPQSVQIVELTVDSVNQPPEPQPDYITSQEGQTKTYNVITNDYDPDEDTNPELEDLTVVSVGFSAGETNTHVGSWSVSADKKSVIFTPDPAYLDWNGTLSFEYVVTDSGLAGGSANVVTQSGCTLTIQQVNDAPVAVPDGTSTSENTPVTLDIFSNDSDVDMDGSLNADPEAESIWVVSNGFSGLFPGSSVEYNSETGELTYTPADDFNGTDELYYTLSDGEVSVQGTVTISVAPVEDNPTANDDTGITVAEDAMVTIDVTANDTDIDSDTSLNLGAGINDNTRTVTHINGVAISGTMEVAHGSVVLSGNKLEYSGDADYAGPDSFTYTITNMDGNQDTATVYITVTAVNDDPWFAAEPEDMNLTEDSANGTGTLTVDEIDAPFETADADLDVVFVSSTNPTLVGAGSVTLSDDDNDAVWDIIVDPQDNQNGTAIITLRVTDEHYIAGVSGYDECTFTVMVDDVNDAPVGDDVSDAGTDEDTKYTIAWDDITSDVDESTNSDVLSVAITTQAEHGTATVNGGNIEYMPDANYNGTDSFVYTVTDSYDDPDLWDTGVITIEVRPVNDKPVGDDVSDASTNEDAVYTIAWGDITSDVDEGTNSDVLSVAITTPAAHGTAVVNGGNIEYTPDADYNGPDSFVYTVTDSYDQSDILSDTGEISILVTQVNDAPDAKNDTQSVNEDEAKVIDVLANDTDTDTNEDLNWDELHLRSAFIITGKTDGTHGTVTIAGDGKSVTYTPAADYAGTDSFTYTMSDGNGGSDGATVYITVIDSNDAPTADPLTDTSVDEDDPEKTYDIDDLIDDPDFDNPGGEVLSVTIVGSTNSDDIEFDSDTNVLTYTPALNFNGDFVVTYRVTDDGGKFAENTITISVEHQGDTPVCNAEALEINEDEYVGSWGTLDVLGNDSDIDEVTNPDYEDVLITGLVYDQMTYVDMQISADKKSIEIRTAANWNGLVTFTYTVTDAYGLTSFVESTVQVKQANDTPVAGADATSTLEDTPVTLDILGNDGDIDTNSLLNEFPDNDSVSISNIAGAVNGQAVFNAETGELTYTPDPDFSGTENITYTLSDEHGASTSGAVTITVTPVLEPPRAADDTASVGEDETSVTIDVLENDYDPDSDSSKNESPTDPAMTVVSITSPVPSGCGTAQISGNAVVFYPAADFDGSATLEYTVENSTGRTDTATITILMTEFDDAPVAQDAFTQVPEDSSVSVDLNAYVSDVDTGDVLTVGIDTDCLHGEAVISDNVLTYTPDHDYNGEDSLKFIVSDRNSLTDTATLHITVQQVNDAPVVEADTAAGAEDSDVSILVLLNDSDVDTIEGLNERPEDEWLEIAPDGFAGLENGTVRIVDGHLVYSPRENWHGVETFTYTAVDQSGVRVSGNVTVTIAPVNDTPALATGYTRELDEDSRITYQPADLVFDPDIQSIGDAVVCSIQTQPVNGTLTLDSEGRFTYTPKQNFNGYDEFTIKAVDKEGAQMISIVAVHVRQVNDQPDARDVSAGCDEDASVAIDVLASASDVDMTVKLNEFPSREKLSIVENSFEGLAHGIAEVSGGMIVYTPDKDFYGEEVFTYQLRDNAGKVDTATATVRVASVLDVPVIVTFTNPGNGEAYKSGQEVPASFTVDNPENVDIVYSIELFDGAGWKTLGDNVTKREIKYIVEDYILQTDKAKFAVTGYYNGGSATNREESPEFIIDNVAPVDTRFDVQGDTDRVTVTLTDSVDMLEYEYVYCVDGGEMIEAEGNTIVVGSDAQTVTLYVRDKLGNLREVGTIRIADELIAQGGSDAPENRDWVWYLIGIAGAVLALLILAALLWRNIIFEFEYADGGSRKIRVLRRHRKDGISVSLKNTGFESGDSVRMTLKKRLTSRMRGRTVSVYMDGAFVQRVDVPANASGRYSHTIE